MDGRNGNGQFAKGNPGGPGRPKRITELAYLRSFVDAVSLDDWRAVISSTIEHAKAGDAKAREWLTKYLIGDPVPISKLAAREVFDPDGQKLLTHEVTELVDDDDPDYVTADARRLIAKAAKRADQNESATDKGM
jgi:hypothetical protein